VGGHPLLHCGTWLRRAAELPRVERVFHAGGVFDFENHLRWLAPWDRLSPLLEHPDVTSRPEVARRVNESTNLRLLSCLRGSSPSRS
jgi:hypothetical protein